MSKNIPCIPARLNPKNIIEEKIHKKGRYSKGFSNLFSHPYLLRKYPSAKEREKAKRHKLKVLIQK